MKICDCKAYEKYTGECHHFEAWNVKIMGAAPYTIFLDGSFFATAESGAEIGDEIEKTITWFGWTRTNPNFS